MAYSMTDVSGMSGVSLSELSHYAELGLLSPAFRGLDEDMYYEKELLTLQQILFCKEAGVAEEEIGSMLKEEPLEIIRVMRQHRIRLLEEALRLHGLIQTLDRTVSYLQESKRWKSMNCTMALRIIRVIPDCQKPIRQSTCLRPSRHETRKQLRK